MNIGVAGNAATSWTLQGPSLREGTVPLPVANYQELGCRVLFVHNGLSYL
jgi:hypothetical protein